MPATCALVLQCPHHVIQCAAQLPDRSGARQVTHAGLSFDGIQHARQSPSAYTQSGALPCACQLLQTRQILALVSHVKIGHAPLRVGDERRRRTREDHRRQRSELLIEVEMIDRVVVLAARPVTASTEARAGVASKVAVKVPD